jgi:hypothetical protein
MSPSAMRFQRDQALACMILALCTCLAAFLSAFGGGDPPAITAARSAVAFHEGLLLETAKALQQNQDALRSVQDSLGALQRARRP